MTDHRDVAAGLSGVREGKYKYDEKKMEITVETECGLLVLKAKFEVCPTCEGKGSHVNPSIDSHGLSAEDFAEDPDFREDYMNGTYDVPCAECGGKRVVMVPDESMCGHDELDLFYKEEASDRQYASECCREREMGF